MPILDGVQAARRLRQMEAQQQLTVSLPSKCIAQHLLHAPQRRTCRSRRS